jgi:hypothetical protein
MVGGAAVIQVRILKSDIYVPLGETAYVMPGTTEEGEQEAKRKF